MASFTDPPPDYAPPTDFVDPALRVIDLADSDPTEVGELLRRRAERDDQTAQRSVNDVAPGDHGEPCDACIAAARHAQLVGVVVGAVATTAILGAAYLGIRTVKDDSER